LRSEHADHSRDRQPPRKSLVVSAAYSVGFGWLFILSGLVLALGATIGLAFGMPSRVPISSQTERQFLWVVGVFVLSSFLYLALALSVRCPHCGFQFLKNPRGLGPIGFVYHSSCKSIQGFNPWAYQIGRFIARGRIRCIKCGEEVFDAIEAQPAAAADERRMV
jgi:DNA-directed RNA polymerase subunit RPC12/RpoP